jgi:hypothetical protein
VICAKGQPDPSGSRFDKEFERGTAPIKRILCLALLLCAVKVSATTVLKVFTLSSKSNINFAMAGVDQKVASFLVPDTGKVSFETILSFTNDCNVQHFTRSSLNIPITKVRIAINGGAIQDLWTRAGSNCVTAISWIPPDPSPALYQDKYQIDVFISWDATPLIIAGHYSETMNINAFIP